MKKKVPTEKEIARKHGVSVDYVIRQAEVGSTVEREHVTTHEEAYGIALQHIAEFPDYYKHLLKMEKKLKGEWRNGKKAVKEEKEETRYCHLCQKEETKSECSYGPNAWEMASRKPHAMKEGKTYSQFMAEANSVSFEIGSGHKSAQKQAKIRNLADRTTNPGEKEAAQRKLKGPNLPMKEGAAWTKKSGKSPSGGLNEKGRKSYERENPGSDLKAPQPEGGPRKKSFCARMGGMPGPMKDEKGRPTRKALALRKWKC
jgi:cytochrome c2